METPEISTYPTPVTDAACREYGGHFVTTSLAMRLEQRLAACRAALQDAVDSGGNFADLLAAQRTARETLKLTEPK